MHIPKYFENQDTEEIYAFIRANSFGIIVSTIEGRSSATHIPFFLFSDEYGKYFLSGHMSKANLQSTIESESEVLVIFNGPHAYVSSSWYGHENVPTWNYIAVHVYGTIHRVSNEELLLDIKNLTDKYESKSAKPIKVEDLSDQTLKQLNGIVGIRIEIKEIQAAYKLSQNRNDADHQNIIHELNRSDDVLAQATADAMKMERGKT